MMCGSRMAKVGSDSFCLVYQVLWYYDYPTVVICMLDLFLLSACAETWSQTLLACFPIPWLTLHTLYPLQNPFPVLDPLFSPLWLQGIPLVPRYTSLGMLGLLHSISFIGNAKNQFSPSQRQKGGCIFRLFKCVMEWGGKMAECCGEMDSCCQDRGCCHSTVVSA